MISSRQVFGMKRNVLFAPVLFAAQAFAQAPQAPQVISPEVLPDHHVTFRLLAPKAESVGLRGGDIPQLAGGGRGAPPNPGPTFTKGE
ncbi:MAG: hypothetical protein QOJ99_3027, partial [Bryobacterales bacterium]|nr:hypothetical protein [Bryobacterales bacterium]